MEGSDQTDLDLEFKRYLQILRPYLGQLTNKTVIAICDSWIKRLSDCDDKEKCLRNKYVFTLCYQLAKGRLEEPFLNPPPTGKLAVVDESITSEAGSSECFLIDVDDNTDTFNKLTSDNDYLFNESKSKVIECDSKSMPTSKGMKKTILCFNCPEITTNVHKYSPNFYETRANELISKLRDIKTENILLHKELMAMKRESRTKCDYYEEDNITKVDNATSTYLAPNESSTTLKSLKFQLQEVQESRNALIDKIAALQDQIDNYNEQKRNEIENIEAKHKLEIINIKSVAREETKIIFEKTIEDLKNNYDQKIRDIEEKASKDKQELNSALDDKNKTISLKDLEIKKLNNQIDELKTHLHTVLEKFIDKPCENSNNDNKFKTQQLEKRLNRMEKSKIRCTRAYEAKLAQLQREKHLAECSLQLQMVRQRAQVVNEATDENQTELAAALDKLETKYKEIVANVQATAIQRRMQDQLSLESILQAACGIPNENNNSVGSNQFSKTVRNQNRNFDGEISPLLHCNKVGNIGAGNKSFGEDSLVTGYCLNSERMGELFERVCIPQRDNPETK